MTSKCCGDQAVLVAVYAETPRRNPLLEDNRQGGHHHHHHHFHQNVSANDGRIRGYNRRAELLDYARHLRASAQSAAASASVPSQPFSYERQLSTVKISTADRKQKHSSFPTCLNKWECIIPNFFRSKTALKIAKDKRKKNQQMSVSMATKMKALVKSLHVKGSLVSERLRTLKKSRQERLRVA